MKIAPFNGDPGADALSEFWGWRDLNRSEPVKSFLIDFLGEYGLDTKQISAVEGNLVEIALGDLHSDANLFDDLVLTVAFAQLMKDGFVDREIHSRAMDAASRQSNTAIISFRYDESSHFSRKNGLTEISAALTLMPTR